MLRSGIVTAIATVLLDHEFFRNLECLRRCERMLYH